MFFGGGFDSELMIWKWKGKFRMSFCFICKRNVRFYSLSSVVVLNFCLVWCWNSCSAGLNGKRSQELNHCLLHKLNWVNKLTILKFNTRTIIKQQSSSYFHVRSSYYLPIVTSFKSQLHSTVIKFTEISSQMVNAIALLRNN